MRGRQDRATVEAVDRLAVTELERSSRVLFVGVTLVVFLVEALTWAFGQFYWADPVLLAVFAVLAVLVWYRVVASRLLPWAWVFAAVAIALTIAAQMLQGQTMMALGYLLVACAVFPALTLLWRPTFVAAGLTLAIVVLVGLYSYPKYGHDMWGRLEPIDAVIQTIAALAAGCMALYFRRASLAGAVSTASILEAEAETDGLTGVLNRRGIERRGRDLVDRTRGHRFVLFVDVDGLKEVNDTKGHDLGDELIRAVATSLQQVVRAADLIGRYGGDEFVVVGAGTEPDPEGVRRRVLEVLDTLGATAISSRGVSVGGASGLLDYDALIEAADEDMYERRARQRGLTPPE